MSSEGIAISGRSVAAAIFALAFATIAGAWIYQALGYLPCDLCYVQRYPYYVGVPLAGVAFALSGRKGALSLGLFTLLALIFATSVAVAVYHSGVELKLWQGPTACSGSALDAAPGADLLKQMDETKVVRCDDVGLRVFSLTLANWNVFISLALTALGALGVARSRRSPL